MEKTIVRLAKKNNIERRLYCTKCNKFFFQSLDGLTWEEENSIANIFYMGPRSIIRCPCGTKIGIMTNEYLVPGEVIPI